MPKFERIYWLKTFDWKHYSKLYDKYCKSKNNYYKNSSKILINSIKINNNSRIIDLGCGTGSLTRELLKKYPRMDILAIDLSKEMLELYRKKFRDKINKKQIKVVEENAEKLNKLTNNKYDGVFVSSALWDMKLEPLFKSLSKVLKKNGKLVFNLPALVVEKETGFIFFIEHFFRQTLNSGLIYRRIKIDYLKDLAKRNNLRVKNIKHYEFNLSKKNVSQFFDLLRYRYPFILFPKEIPYSEKLKKCTEIFKDSLRYIPKEGIKEEGFIFIIEKN